MSGQMGSTVRVGGQEGDVYDSAVFGVKWAARLNELYAGCQSAASAAASCGFERLDLNRATDAAYHALDAEVQRAFQDLFPRR